jgi:hypothetical protein
MLRSNLAFWFSPIPNNSGACVLPGRSKDVPESYARPVHAYDRASPGIIQAGGACVQILRGMFPVTNT